jgi:hypothetical protein
MEERIKKSWESAFKGLVGSVEGKSAEDIAAMFFELGWKAGIENEHSSIAAAINVFNNLKVS